MGAAGSGTGISWVSNIDTRSMSSISCTRQLHALLVRAAIWNQAAFAFERVVYCTAQLYAPPSRSRRKEGDTAIMLRNGRALSHLSASCSFCLSEAAAAATWLHRSFSTAGLSSNTTSHESASLASPDSAAASTAVRPTRSIRQIRAAMFGEPIQPGQRDGRAILARKLQGKEIASWYFLPPTESPGFHNEERE